MMRSSVSAGCFSSSSETLCTKLLGYALGRSELLSDRSLIQGMMTDIDGGGPFSNLVVRIVLSDQFRSQRF